MKILHTADWHLNANKEESFKSVDYILNYIEENKIDLVLHAGDIFDSRVFLDVNSNEYLNKISLISEWCPMIIIYGTPSHDYKGSLDSLGTRKTKYPITIVNKPQVITTEEGIVINCLPWPMKRRYLNDEELKLDIKKQDELYNERFEQWLEMSRSLKNNNELVILLSHIQLIGSVPSLNQDINSEVFNPELFYDICDYGALGHIHKEQRFKHLYYSGSIYQKTWNEVEKKYFNVIEIDNNEIKNIEQIEIPIANPIKCECSLEEYIVIKKKNRIEKTTLDTDTNLWLIINTENRSLVNYEKEIQHWKDRLYKIRIDINLMKTDVMKRLETYDNKISLLEKFELWCTQKKIEPTEFQKNKIEEIEK